MYNYVLKVFLQEHFVKPSSGQPFLRKFFHYSNFLYILTHERKRLLRHRILSHRSKRLPVQRRRP